jgi:uncharacterized protein YecE (DUF72 family)
VKVNGEAHPVTKILVGTGGWAYFPLKPTLKTYSKVFNFVEVNSTFYRHPDSRTVERWRRSVPHDFTFTVRCHHQLTHKIGFMPTEDAYAVFSRMIGLCRILGAPFLHLETPETYVLDDKKVKLARDFFSTVNFKGVRVAWENRSQLTSRTVDLMHDFNIVHSVDLSREEPALRSDVTYSRLFGKGRHNIYQFTDEELMEIDQKILKAEAKTAIVSFHGVRMNIDALRFKKYKETNLFPPATRFVGVDSAKAVLSEDAEFPSTKAELIEDQGWKVVDLTKTKRVHLSEWLKKTPEKTYENLEEVIKALEANP